MAYWNGDKKVYSSPTLSKLYPGWEELDCGCCGGIQWGGEDPRECLSCNGGGTLFHHIKSGVRALWPGGPFARA